MASVAVTVSLPQDVHHDVAVDADIRGVTFSKMLAYYVVQGFALTQRGYYVTAGAVDGRFIGPKPELKKLPYPLEGEA